MRTRLSVACAGIALTLLALSTANAGAQTCMGTTSFRRGPGRIDAVASLGKDANVLGGALSLGAAKGPFVTGSVSQVTFDGGAGGDETAPLFGVQGGYAIDVGQRANPSAIEVCPFLGFQYLAGPDIDGDVGVGTIEIRSRSFLAGFSIGGEIVSSPTLSFVPSAGFAYVSQKTTVEATAFPRDTTDETFGMITAGVGVVLDQRLTIGFFASLPVGLDDGGSSFGVSLGVAF